MHDGLHYLLTYREIKDKIITSLNLPFRTHYEHPVADTQRHRRFNEQIIYFQHLKLTYGLIINPAKPEVLNAHKQLFDIKFERKHSAEKIYFVQINAF